jgi:RNA-binding protein
VLPFTVIHIASPTEHPIEMLDKETSRRLKKQAHILKPLIRIGKNGVTEGAIVNIDAALSDFELIKIKYLDYKEEKRQLTELITTKTGSQLVDLIGNTAILYRQNPTKKKNTKI